MSEEQNEMRIKLRRVTGTPENPVPVCEAVPIPDPAYRGAKMKTEFLDPSKSVLLVDEVVADAIFSNPFSAVSFEVHPDSKALPKRLANDPEFKKVWDEMHAEKVKNSEKAETKNSDKSVDDAADSKKTKSSKSE